MIYEHNLLWKLLQGSPNLNPKKHVLGWLEYIEKVIFTHSFARVSILGSLTGDVGTSSVNDGNNLSFSVKLQSAQRYQTFWVGSVTHFSFFKKSVIFEKYLWLLVLCVSWLGRKCDSRVLLCLILQEGRWFIRVHHAHI